MFTLLSDAGPAMSVADVMPAFSSVGSLGFAIWFAYYTTTTTLPKQQEQHQEQLERITQTHAATIKELVAELRLGREAYDRWRQGTH